MIGNLLRTAASTFSHQGSQRSQPPLESVTEEAHTRDLLFPDLSTLRSGFHNDLSFSSTAAAAARPSATPRDASNHDDRGNLDVSYPADLRIVIAQDANSRYHQPQVLFDSKPYKSPDSRSGSGSLFVDQDPFGRQALAARGKAMTSPTRRGHTPTSSMHSAQMPPLSPISPRSPDLPKRSFFGDARQRPSAFDFGATEHETAQGKLAREAKEETEALLGCMFGAPGFRLEPSTKLHVVPKKTPDTKSSAGVRPISSGSFNRRRTPLVRSTSAADFSRDGWSPSAGSEASDTRSQVSKPAVMVTRLFTVVLPETGSGETDEEGSASAPAPPSNLSDSFSAQKALRAKSVKQKKVPMYAIAVIIQLPPDGEKRLRQSVSHGGISSLGSSLNDQTPGNSWKGDHSAFSSFMEIRAQSSLDSVLNPYIAQVMQHWNILSRSVELLELFVKTKLKTLLEQCAPAAPFVALPRPGVANMKLKKPKPQSQQSVFVMPECFQYDMQIKKSTETAGQTIMAGLRTRRVVVGQGRWGAWREEARWVGRWAGSKEQNFFFFTFLTAFLGSHTAWLESMSPAWYRRRYAQQQRYQGRDNSRIHHRTVIISADKMAARRLIFLLATFFPSNFNHVQPHPPILSTSQPNNTIYSGSPPTFGHAREQSLHRSAAAKRAGGSAKGGESGHGHNRSVSFSVLGTISGAGTGSDNESAITDIYDPTDQRDANKTTLRSPSLAIPRREPGSRKASLSTVTADVAQGVAHIVPLTVGTPGSPATEKRPGSGGSLASTALSQNLRRSESSTLSTSASGRWGSVVSSLWSARRDSTTDDSEVFPSSQESPTKLRPSKSSAGKLQEMVDQAEMMDAPTATSASPGSRPLPTRIEDCLKPQHPAHVEGSSLARNIPRHPKPEKLPLKLSFNESDGYIDVAMPATQSFSSSLASSFASIRLPQPSLGMSNEHYSPYGSITSDSPHSRSEPNIDIAGWLKTYHPDFTVQAVKPYESLVNDVKSSMYAEAQLFNNSQTPQNFVATDAPSNRWTDVCTTLLADTTTFTVSRLRLRRRPRPPPQEPNSSFSSSQPSTPTAGQSSLGFAGKQSPFILPPSPRFADPNFECEIVSEPVMDLDPTLIDAVERVLAQSGPSTRAASRVHSRTVSPSISRPHSPTRASASTSRPESVSSSSRRGNTAAASNTTLVMGQSSQQTHFGGGGGVGSRRATEVGLGLGLGPGLGQELLAQSQLEVPHAECRRMVLGALEEVVRSVVEEKEEDDKRAAASGASGAEKRVIKEGGRVGVHRISGSRGGSGVRQDAAGADGVHVIVNAGDEHRKSVGAGADASKSGTGSLRRGRVRAGSKREMDSTLREGVRRWLVDVEEGLV